MSFENYTIKGWYYKKGELEFRKYLEIKKIGCEKISNDLTVIMMNPGSSKPKSDSENFLDKFVEATPDPTQKQIKAVMEECGFEYAKIINLSDLREPKSKIFYDKIRGGIQNSIFENTDSLSEYLSVESTFIFAWGVNYNLKNLAENALKKIEEDFGKNIKKVGKQHENKFGYYHPYPRKKSDKENWITEICKQIKERKEK